jgi:hypothetical protein
MFQSPVWERSTDVLFLARSVAHFRDKRERMRSVRNRLGRGSEKQEIACPSSLSQRHERPSRRATKPRREGGREDRGPRRERRCILAAGARRRNRERGGAGVALPRGGSTPVGDEGLVGAGEEVEGRAASGR